jgi:2-furoyl-CoA dehydrogenase FAD binding subunit
MKAAPFAYVRPGTVPGVLAELAAADSTGTGGGAKILAGGQSLVPVLAMRLGRPGTLIDINAAAGLSGISAEGGQVRIGATARQREAQAHPATAAVPLLRMALPWIGHREIRSRGTICGSIAHADPAAELPAVACCLDATMTLVSARGRRSVAAQDFFAAAMTTVLAPDELLESVVFPVAGPGEGCGFAEVARRHGDFALAGVAVRVRGAAAGTPSASVVCFGVADRPVPRDVSGWVADVATAADASEDELRAGFAARAGDFAASVVTTAGDMHGSAAYRRRLIRELVAAELARATARSLAGAVPGGPVPGGPVPGGPPGAAP